MHKEIESARPGRGGGPSGYFGLLSLESRIMFDGGALDASADTTITSSQSHYVYNQQDSPIALDGTVISSELDHRGGAIVFAVDNSNSSDQLELVSNPDIYGKDAVSVDEGNVYLGNGADRALIGTIDDDENGQDGANLRINFTDNFVNDDFETYNPGSFLEESRESGWFIPDEAQGNGEVILGDGMFFGWPVPMDDYIFPAGPEGFQREASTGSGTWAMGGSDPGRDYGEQNRLLANTNFLTIGSSNVLLPFPHSVSHGPFAATDEITLVEGEIVRFDWDANPISLGDAYDPFIYLLNTENGNTQPLVRDAWDPDSNQVGIPEHLDWKSVETTIQEDGAYRIVFINGSFDTSGAQSGGSELYIDNVMMGYPVDGTVLTNIANQLTFSNNSETLLESEGRHLIISTDSPDGDDAEYSGSTIAIASEGRFLTNVIPDARTMDEDSLLTFSGDGDDSFQVRSGGTGSEEIQVTLAATNGVLTLSRTTGLDFRFNDGWGRGSGDGANDAGMTFRGTRAEINAALDGMRFSPTADYHGSASIRIDTSDLGNMGADEPLTDSDTAGITVRSVNDAPVNMIPAVQGLDEDSILTFSRANGNPVSVSDVDAGEGEIQVILTATDGLLTLSRTTGVAFVSDSYGSGLGDGVDDPQMIFWGTQDNINAALDGMRFSPTPDYDGSGSIRIETNDLGNSSPDDSDGASPALSDVDIIQIALPIINTPNRTNDALVGNGGDDSVAEMPASTEMHTIVGPGMDNAPDTLLVFSDRGLVGGFTPSNDGNFPVLVSSGPVMPGAQRITTGITTDIAIRGAESAPAAAVCYDADGDVLSLGRGMENTAILIGRGFELQIPYDTFTHTDPEARILLSARQADGSPLPDWLRFDTEKGLFSGTVPVSLAGRIIELEVIARDVSAGCEVLAAFSLCMVDDETEVCRPEAMDEWENEWEEEWEEEDGWDEDLSRMNRKGELPDSSLSVSTPDNRLSVSTEGRACRAAFSAQLAALGRAGFERQQAAFISMIGAGNI